MTRRDFITGSAMTASLAAFPSIVKSGIGAYHQHYVVNDEPCLYTASDYVQDGIASMWDAIENAGLEMHDDNATEWVDLVEGRAGALALHSHWEPAAYVIDHNNTWRDSGKTALTNLNDYVTSLFSLDKSWTIEVCYEVLDEGIADTPISRFLRLHAASMQTTYLWHYNSISTMSMMVDSTSRNMASTGKGTIAITHAANDGISIIANGSNAVHFNTV